MINFNVIIVEDEILIARDIKESLIELKYNVCGIASNVNDALQIIEKEQPDIADL